MDKIMPLIQIHLKEGKSPKYIQAVMNGVHKALVTAWKIPLTDRFQMVSEYKYFHFNKKIWGVKRSDDLIAIYITSIFRSEAMKKKLYQELIRVLGKNLKVRKEDIFVTIVTVNKIDWSFGNGIAQLTDPTQKP
jgi:4-oxalocrotonate tautomerase